MRSSEAILAPLTDGFRNILHLTFRESSFHALRGIRAIRRARGGTPLPLFAVRDALLALDYLLFALSVCRSSQNENILAVALVAQAAPRQGDHQQRQHPKADHHGLRAPS